jgi:hypothetical protein
MRGRGNLLMLGKFSQELPEASNFTSEGQHHRSFTINTLETLLLQGLSWSVVE